MAIDYEQLLNLHIPDVHQRYESRDTLLYALSLGLGCNPRDTRELAFVYETGQRCLPSFGTTLGHPGFWLKQMPTGVDWVKVVHAQQQLIIHQPLPVAGEIIGQQQVLDVIDRGKDRGAMIVWQRRIVDAVSGVKMCTINQFMLARGDGGFGGPVKAVEPVPQIPERAADSICERKTSTQTALLYRLSGDWNPLHADPAVAQKAGFNRPILHGLATWGIAASAVLEKICNFDVRRVASIFGRFTAVVYPGETFRISMWQQPKADGTCDVMFQVHVVERDLLVLNNGLIELHAGSDTDAQ